MAKPDIPDVHATVSREQLQDFTRQALTVPKKQIDAKMAKEKAARKKRK